MPAAHISGFSVAYMAIGGILLLSGIKGTTLSTTLRDLTRGQAPSQDEQPITGTPGTTGTAQAPTASPGDTGAANANAAQNQALARILAAPYGWATGTQWEDLVSLWNRESGWNITATNPTSGAYGIPQALPATKMASAGSDWKYSAATQISWGLAYIKQRYGSPEAAWAHEEANGWY